MADLARLAEGGHQLGDALGPRGRRRVLIASLISTVLVAVALFAAFQRMESRGQFRGTLWEPFTTWVTWRFLLQGLASTVRAAALAMALSLVLGTVLAVGRLSTRRPVRWAAGLYVEVFRAWPLLLLVLFAPKVLRSAGLSLEPFWPVVLALTLYNAAILAEIIRAGIRSLEGGQGEAAAALGLTHGAAMRLILLPQAFRRMVPSLVSQLITLLKDTSLGSLVFYDELLSRGKGLANGDFTRGYPPNPLQMYLVVGAIYLVVNLTLSQLARWLERRQQRRHRGGPVPVAAVAELAAEGLGPPAR